MFPMCMARYRRPEFCPNGSNRSPNFPETDPKNANPRPKLNMSSSLKAGCTCENPSFGGPGLPEAPRGECPGEDNERTCGLGLIGAGGSQSARWPGRLATPVLSRCSRRPRGPRRGWPGDRPPSIARRVAARLLPSIRARAALLPLQRSCGRPGRPTTAGGIGAASPAGPLGG